MRLDLDNITDSIIPEGQYSFVISEVVECVSKKGDDMLRIKYTITDGEHQNKNVSDFFLPNHPTCSYGHKKKLKELVIACGLPLNFEDTDLKDKFFRADIVHDIDDDIAF